MPGMFRAEIGVMNLQGHLLVQDFCKQRTLLQFVGQQSYAPADREARGHANWSRAGGVK